MRATTKEARFERAVRRATEWVMEDPSTRVMNVSIGRTHDWQVQISEMVKGLESHKVAMLYFAVSPMVFNSDIEIFIPEDVNVDQWLEQETKRANKERTAR